MNLYLDDDSTEVLLIRLLRAAGHDVQIPGDAGLAGRQDPEHLMYAIRAGRVLLTHNHPDYELLHALVLLAGGGHPGILTVRRDKDRKRDLKARGVVRA